MALFMWCFVVLSQVPAGARAAPAAEATAAPSVESIPRPPIDAALCGSGTASERVRETADELLHREGFRVSWSRPARLTSETILETKPAGETSGSVWIDLQSATEAGLIFRDAGSDRYVVRRVSLRHGLDEIAKEEIAHIVASVVVALAAGTAPTLSRTEARAALAPARTPDVTPLAARAVPPAARATIFEIDSRAIAEALSRQIPLSVGIEISLVVLVAPPSLALRQAWGGWFSVGTKLPARYDGSEVALDLWTTMARAGVCGQLQPVDRVSLRASAGAGIDRVDYRPRNVDPAVAATRSGTFIVPMARLSAGVAIALGRHWALVADAVAEFSLDDVHYDVREPGEERRVLVPFRLRPGLEGGVAWRL